MATPVAEPLSHLIVISCSHADGSLGPILASLHPLRDRAAIAVALDGAAAGAEAEVARRHDAWLATEPRDLVPGLLVVPPEGARIVDDRIVPGVSSGSALEELLRTAAGSFEERLILVLLAGPTAGAVAAAALVNGSGGTVIVEKPRAGARRIPRSLPPTAVDVVVEPDALAGTLMQLIERDGRAVRADQTRLRSLLDHIKQRSGIDFSGYKPATILRRLDRRAAAVGARDLAEYIRHLEAHPDEYQRLVSSFLIKVTEFFRDPALYAYLRDRVVPDLVRTAREHDNTLRLWSAGCATGEEPYSLALLVAEALGDDREAFNVRIFATDIDNAAIGFARKAVYPETAVRGLPPELLDRYFIHADGEYEVAKTIRSLCVFGQHDLGERAPFPRVDLIMCRNVLIYFTNDLQARTLRLFAFSLRDQGYLVLGSSETTNPLSEHFAVEQSRLKVFRRQGERILIPPGRARVEGIRRIAPHLGDADALVPAPRPRARAQDDRADRLIVGLPIGVVIVDREYDVVQMNSQARRLLELHGGPATGDFVHLATTLPPAQLRAVIDAALRGETAKAVFEVSGSGAEPRSVEVTGHPGYVERAEVGATALLIITDVTAAELVRRQDVTDRARTASDIQALGQRMSQLLDTNRQLVQANEDLAHVNVELRSANDELLVANEEVQAATEEVETLNEELQAANEELETLNEELQATIEELNTTNEDLQSRSAELEQVARALNDDDGSERQDLLGRLASVEPMIVVGPSGERLLSNAAYDALGAPARFEDQHGRALGTSGPLERARQLKPFKMTVRVAGDGRRSFTASGEPIHRNGTPVASLVILHELRAPA